MGEGCGPVNLRVDLVVDLVKNNSVTKVGIHEAKTHLSRLLRRVAAGEEIVIAKGGKPVARLVPVQPPESRSLGRDKGILQVPDDFDAPLPEEILAEFER